MSKRKRNHNTRDVAEVSEALHLHCPTGGKEGNAKQFVQMTKTATGFALKHGQAAQAVRSKVNTGTEAQIGQCMWLPSLFASCGAMDPRGIHLLEHRTCPWNAKNGMRQFVRCCVCSLIAQHFWSCASIDLVVCDGTFTKCPGFGHILLIAVTFDGNNNVVTLAFAIVPQEDAGNWVCFKEHLEQDFKGFAVWMSDADKGIRSNAFSQSVSQDDMDASFDLSRCARHSSGNCQEDCKSPMNQDQKCVTVEVAKSRTERVCEDGLNKKTKINKEWGEFLDARKEECLSMCFLRRGIRRWGKVTSNAVESVNGVLLEARDMAIVDVIIEIVDCQQKKCHECQQQGEGGKHERRILTPFGSASDLSIGDCASKKRIQMIEANPFICRAKVSVDNTSGPRNNDCEVTASTLEKRIRCPCLFKEETGMICLHAKCLLLWIGEGTSNCDWCNKRFHLETHRKTCAMTIPSMCLAGRLEVDNCFVPPGYKRPAGRPKKRRMEHSVMSKTNKQKTCKAHGHPEHFASACEQPSTEYRFNHMRDGAVKWCEKTSSL